MRSMTDNFTATRSHRTLSAESSLESIQVELLVFWFPNQALDLFC